MKQICRILSCLLILALLPAASALADLQRGNRGEEVVHIQTMLFETGFLFEQPDGNFGKSTEQAVKDYQKYIDAEITGIATNEMMGQLQETWYEVVCGGQPEGNGTEGFAPSGMYPACCNHWNTPEGSSVIDYCERHMDIRLQVEKLMAADDTENARKACELWREEIRRLYDIWTQSAGKSCQASIAASQTLFWTSMEAREAAVRSVYDDASIEPGELANVEYVMETSLREHAAWLCQLLSNLYGEYN